MLIAPKIGDGAQRHQQGSRTDQHDVVFERFADQLRLTVDGQQESRLDRNKHQYVVQRTQAGQLLVILASQQADMATQRANMLTQRRLAFHFIFTVEVTFVGHQRHFRIDDHVLTLR
ncbi:hypothetical protein D3C81_1221070 [compost metagenome]